MKLAIIVSAVAVSVATLSAYKLSRVGYESPQYIEVVKDGPFEIRDYPALTLVSTPRPGLNPQESSSFMKLFRYISGGNQRSEKIAMTTPVITTRNNSKWRMSFVVPALVAEKGAPQPTDKEVQLETMPGGRFAVYRFSGVWDPMKFDEAKKKLARWMEQKELRPIAGPQIANYDPPFTPAMLRRNEILVRIGE